MKNISCLLLIFFCTFYCLDTHAGREDIAETAVKIIGGGVKFVVRKVRMVKCDSCNGRGRISVYCNEYCRTPCYNRYHFMKCKRCGGDGKHMAWKK